MADAAEVKTEEPVEKEGEGDTKKEKKEKKTKGKAAGKSGAKGQGKGKSTGPFGGGQGYRLNVKNLASEDDAAQVKLMFEIFGNVVDAQVKTHEDGTSKGFGFVIFATEEQAKEAMADMDGKEHHGKKLYVAPAERRPEVEGQAMMGKGAGKGKGYGMDPMSLAMQQHQQQLAMWQYQQYYALAMMQQQMAMGYDGGYSANDTWFPPAAAAAAAGGEGEYEGSIKSIGKEGKYAFIVCAETHLAHGRDVYLKSDLFPPGMKAASRVKFTVVLSDKQHPQAATCRMA